MLLIQHHAPLPTSERNGENRGKKKKCAFSQRWNHWSEREEKEIIHLLKAKGITDQERHYTVTFLGGFSTKPQKLIKYNKQISCISRGRIVINQVRVLQLSARPHLLTHWASDFKDGMK